MPVLSNAAIRDVRLGSTKAKKVYLGTKLVWEDNQGLAKNYSGTGWYKAVDTGTVFCKGIPSLQTHSFTGDPKVYISVHNDSDARKYTETAATSNITDMSLMFENIATFNKDISHWDVSNVTTMSGMFWKASAFNQDISKWNVSKVTNMNSMFRDAKAFNRNLSKWCVTNIKTLPYNFSSNSALTAANTPKWGTCP